MEIKVDLSAEQINNQITEAIAKSAIGVELKRAIDEQVKAMSQSFNNPFKNIITGMIRNEIERIVKEDYTEQIHALVKEKVTADFSTEMLNTLWKAWEAQKDRYWWNSLSNIDLNSILDLFLFFWLLPTGADMTFDDDFCRIWFLTGAKNIPCKNLNINWPPPDKISIEGFEFSRTRFSNITDEQRETMDHVCRGAEYKSTGELNES